MTTLERLAVLRMLVKTRGLFRDGTEARIRELLENNAFRSYLYEWFSNAPSVPLDHELTEAEFQQKMQTISLRQIDIMIEMEIEDNYAYA